MTDETDIIYRLRKRAEIRRQIPTRKSVQENKPDRIADILEEAAREIEYLRVLSQKNIEIEKYPPQVNSFKGCSKCGIGANGEIMGYVCGRSDCPTRVTC